MSSKHLFTLALSLSACAAAPDEGATATDGTAVVADPTALAHPPMRPLAFLVGRWRGSGSIALGAGPRHTFTQTEEVVPKLDGVALTIEGLGRGEDGAVVHHAFAVLFHDAAAGGYRIRAFTREGRTVETEATVDGASVAWGFDLGAQRVAYRIEVGADHRWVETGRMSRDGGATWLDFFAMELDRL